MLSNNNNNNNDNSHYNENDIFNSFAPIRTNQNTKWFVDGCDYMASVADSIKFANSEIFISGFFLTPEIYLKRNKNKHKWRLDLLLKEKAVSFHLALAISFFF